MKNSKLTHLRCSPVTLFVVLCTSLWISSPAQADGERFVPNAAGDEITDTRTGLIWRRCAEGQAWTGSTCEGQYSYFSWEDALAQAKSQAASSGKAWRVPNMKELQSLVNRQVSFPAIDTVAFPATSSHWFWTSTPYVGDSRGAWIVHFGFGYIYYDFRYLISALRLVRTDQ